MNGPEKSDSPIVAVKPANEAARAAEQQVEPRGGTKENADQQTTVRTQSREAVSHAQARIREAVTRNRAQPLTTLLHHVSVDVLRAGFFGLKKNAAPGVDGLTWTQYEEGLEANLQSLHARVHGGGYRALASRRRYIPKADGRRRPLGIAALEDKIVQAAVAAILTPIYETEFLGFSYGFRPERGQHDALDALAYGLGKRRINWVLDADIRSFLKWRPDWPRSDGRGRLAIENAGDQLARPCRSAALLANVYLHYVYDLWVRQWRQRQSTGDMIVVRYADDTIVGFEHQDDAERFLEDLSLRMADFELGLHPEKTRLIEFGRRAIARRRARGLSKPETFDFLGFTHYCATRRSGGGFVLGRTPARKRMRAKLRQIKEQLKATRHDGVEAQGKWLAQVLRGWLAYYAVPMSAPAITAFRHHLVDRWLHAIRRRGQKHRLAWPRMKVIANRYLSYPRIQHPWPEQRFLVNHPR